MGIQKEVYDFGHSIEAGLKERFEQIDKMAEYNQLKVIHAMQKNKVSAECFNQSSGYGYNDLGRDTLEKVYADVFCAEDALVRPQITCGTHALALALMSNLRPGDELLSPVGKPYDTLEEVIGIRPSKGSLAEYGISYRQVDLLEDGSFDFENIKKYTEGELEFSLLGGTSGDEIFVVMPRCTADLDCINTIHRYLNGYTKVSNNDIGKILVLKLAPPDENIKQYAHWEVYYLYDIICNNTDKLMAIMDTLIQKNLKRRMNNEQNI